MATSIFTYKGTDYEFPDTWSDDEALKKIKVEHGDTIQSTVPSDQTKQTSQETQNQGGIGSTVLKNVGNLPANMIEGAQSIKEHPKKAIEGAIFGVMKGIYDLTAIPGRIINPDKAKKLDAAVQEIENQLRQNLLSQDEQIIKTQQGPSSPSQQKSFESGKALGEFGGPMLAGGGTGKLSTIVGKAAIEKFPALAETPKLLSQMGKSAVETSPYAAEVGSKEGVKAGLETELLGTGAGVVATKAIPKLMSELSGASEGALKKYGWGPLFGANKGASLIRKEAGNQMEIGSELLDKIDNFWSTGTEKDQIQSALKIAKPISIDPIVKKSEERMQELRGGIGTEKTDITKVKDMQDDLKAQRDFSKIIEISKTGDQAGTVKTKGDLLSPDRFLEIRKRLDKQIGDAWGKESSTYISELKSIRSNMKDELLKATDGTLYGPAMQSLAKKMDAIDKLTNVLGKTSETRERRVESFINNIFGKNKTKQQEFINNLDELLKSETSTLDRARNAQYAKELGSKGGAPALLPKEHTGFAALPLILGGAEGMQYGHGISGGIAGAVIAEGASGPAAATKIVAGSNAARNIVAPALNRKKLSEISQ